MSSLRTTDQTSADKPSVPVMSRMPRGGILAAFFVAFAVCLCWPIFYTGNFYVFPDTGTYIRGGDKIWDVLLHVVEKVFPSGQSVGEASVGTAVEALQTNERGRNVSGRSITYSALMSVTYHLVGAVGFALVQATLITTMIALFVSREGWESSGIVALGAVFLVTLTALPWYTTYLMPDIFGALVLLLGMILVRGMDDLSIWAVILALLIGGFAISSHYGNIPLSLVVITSALGIRLLRRRLGLRPLVAGIVALSFAPALNLTASSAVLDEPSVTPKRLPIALARSLADGPALWYLQDVCPEADLALCEAYGDGIHSDTNWFLWSDEGVLSLSREQFDRVKEEELKVLIGAFKAYPIQQIKAFFHNGFSQLFRIGTDGLKPAVSLDENYEPHLTEKPEHQKLRRFFDGQVIPYTTLACAVALVVCIAIFGISARWFDIIAVFVIGYLANAYIFGGFSAPIDRYQGRTAWLIPLILFAFLAETATERRRRAASNRS